MGAGEAVLRGLPGCHADRSGAVPFATAPLNNGEQRQVDVERTADNASGPDPGAAPAGRPSAGPALQHELRHLRSPRVRLGAGERVQLQGLPPAGVGFTERHPVGEGFEVGSVEVHLELIARLRGVEPRLGMQAVDVGVDVHDEHRAALAVEDVQVIDVELAGLGLASGVSRRYGRGMPSSS